MLIFEECFISIFGVPGVEYRCWGVQQMQNFIPDMMESMKIAEMVNTNMKVLHYVTCEDYIVKLAFWESVLWKILRWRGANFGELIGGLVIWMVCCCRGGYMSCLCIGSMCVLFICHSRCKRNWMLFSPYRTLVAQVPHISWGRKGFIIVPCHISIYTKEIWIVSPGDRTVSPPDNHVVFP